MFKRGPCLAIVGLVPLLHDDDDDDDDGEATKNTQKRASR